MSDWITRTETKPLTPPMGIEEWIEETRRMIVEVYPADIFTGESGCVGSLIARKIDKCHDEVTKMIQEARDAKAKF